MLRLLSYNHPFTYVLLFVLAFAFRAPSFHSQYYDTDESFYLSAAEQIVDGGVQYVDTWDNKPPVLIWFYSFFVWVFGDFAALAIRIFTCIYLFLGALALNQIAVDNRILSSFSMLPGFLFLFLTAVPWYTQEMNGELLMSMPIILAVGQVIRVKERSDANKVYMFLAGLLFGLSFMIKYQAIFIFLGILAAYFSAHTPRLEEVFSYFAGFFLMLAVFLGILFFSGSLAAYWDIGFLYNLDYIFVGKNPSESPDILFNIFQYFKLWGFFILFAAIGIAHFRANYFTYGIRLRKIELIVALWFATAVLTILIGIGRLYLHYFYLLVPPLSIYAAKFFEFRFRKAIRTGALVVAFLIPLYTFGVWSLAAFPKLFSFMDPYVKGNTWVEGMRRELNETHPLKSEIDHTRLKNGVLVLDYAPRLYQWLDIPVATRFTNFSMAYYKFSIFPEAQKHDLVSAKWPAAKIFKAFEEEMPDYFIDDAELGLFPVMQKKMPVLFAGFEGRKVTGWYRDYIIYSRK